MLTAGIVLFLAGLILHFMFGRKTPFFLFVSGIGGGLILSIYWKIIFYVFY